MGLQIMVIETAGTMGQELAKALQKAKMDFIAASRSVNFPEGVRGLRLDCENPSLLEHALRGMDVLVFYQQLHAEMVKEAQRVFEAARAAGVRFILRISENGASPLSPYLFQRIHGEVDHLVQESGIDYCILRPNILMQDFIDLYGEDIRRGTLFLPQGEGRTSYVDARDVAEATVAVLQDPWHYLHQSLDLTGERTISNAEALSIISYNVIHRLAYVPVTEEAALQVLQKGSLEPWFIKTLMSVHRAVREGHMANVSDAIFKILGRAPRRFEDFCRDMRHAWMAPPRASGMEASL